MEAGGSRVLGCPGLHSEFKVNLGYVSCPLPPNTHTQAHTTEMELVERCRRRPRCEPGFPPTWTTFQPLPGSISLSANKNNSTYTVSSTQDLHCFATSTRLQEHLLHVHGLLNTMCSCGPLLLSSYNEEAEGQSWLGSWFPSEFKGGAKRQERKGDNLCHNTRAKCDSQ